MLPSRQVWMWLGTVLSSLITSALEAGLVTKMFGFMGANTPWLLAVPFMTTVVMNVGFMLVSSALYGFVLDANYSSGATPLIFPVWIQLIWNLVNVFSVPVFLKMLNQQPLWKDALTFWLLTGALVLSALVLVLINAYMARMGIR